MARILKGVLETRCTLRENGCSGEKAAFMIVLMSQIQDRRADRPVRILLKRSCQSFTMDFACSRYDLTISDRFQSSAPSKTSGLGSLSKSALHRVGARSSIFACEPKAP